MDRSTDKFNILRTKFCPPNLTSDLVPRDRLINLLNGSQEVPLTVVSAPAGYGKSILASQWLDQHEGLSFWISLDEQDSHLRQFLAHIVTNLESQLDGQFGPVWNMLRSTEKYASSAMSGRFANCLVDLNRPCTIVLDDYHHLRNDSTVHRFLDAFLEYPPPTVHIILLTRRDPQLKLISYRAANQLLEVREDDLRFDESETAGLISNLTHKVPGQMALKNLEEQLEGWAVGLRLTSMVLKQVEDPDAFLSSLRGGIPYTQEYLFSEVLSRLEGDQRELLLQSSLLDRFCPELLEHVFLQHYPDTDQHTVDVRNFINFLQQNNVFIYSLDVEGRWFRFHHLFQHLLQAELSRNTEAHIIAEFHRRASQWFESRNVLDEAIKHALLASDEQSAIRIIERHCYELLEEDRAYVLFAWLEQLPAEVVYQRPVLLLAQAWVASFAQDLDQVEKLLKLVTPLLKSQSGGEKLWGEVDFFRGYLNFWSGDFDESVRLLSRAQGRISENKSIVLAETDLHLGIVLHMDGKQNEAIQMIEQQMRLHGGIQLARRIGTKAFIRALSGELDELRLDANRMLALDPSMRTPLTDGWARLFLGLVGLHTFRLSTAITYFEQVIEEPHLLDRRGAIDAYAGLALAQQLEGQSTPALNTIGQLETFTREFERPEELAVLRSCKARISLLQGADPVELRNKYRLHEAPGIFDVFLWMEAPVITRVRRLLAEASEDSLFQAQTLIDEIRGLCQENHFAGQLIEIEVLQTLLHQRANREEAALESLEKSLALARQEGWVRPYVEAGEPIIELLKGRGKQSDDDFVSRVLSSYRSSSVAIHGSAPGHTPAGRSDRPATTGGICDLTNRELDILELLAKRLQNKEIASQLFISTHTVKDHLKHIYQKLGVNNRRQAVLRANESGLIKPE